MNPMRLATAFSLSLSLLLLAGLFMTLGERPSPAGAWLSLLGMWVAGWLVVRLWDGNLLEWPVLFSLFYVAYVSAPTIEVLFTGTFSSDNPLIQRAWGDFALSVDAAALLGGVGLLAFTAGLVFAKLLKWGKPKLEKATPPFKQGIELPSWVFLLGLVAFAFGVVLYALDLFRLGGWQALLTPRVERLYALSEARGNLPYAPFVFSGIALLALGSLRLSVGSLSWWAFVSLLILWVGFLLAQGDRRYVLYTLLVLVGGYGVFRRFVWKLSFRALLVLLLVYIVASFFGAVRWLLPSLLGGHLGLGEALVWIHDNVSWSWFLPSSNEFVGPYLTLLFTLDHQGWRDAVGAPLGGFSYVASLANLLPRSLYPGEKWVPLSFQFSDWYYANYIPEFPAPIGFGFSPIAEALLNFGNTAFAPIPSLFLLGLFMGWLSLRAWLKPLPWGLIYALLMPQAFNLNRIDFPWAFQEGVYYVFVGLLLWYGGLLLLRRRREGTSKGPASS